MMARLRGAGILVLSILLALNLSLTEVARASVKNILCAHTPSIRAEEPKVRLEAGTAGASMILMNGTSALVKVDLPPTPFYHPNGYNIVAGTHILGSVPASVQRVDNDYFIVGSAVSATSTIQHHPSGYNLLGSTTHVSGSLVNLQSNDGTYMTFRSYSTTIDDLEDFVDRQSNVDDQPDIGSHSNFDNLKARDNVYNVFTEANNGFRLEFYENFTDTRFQTSSITYIDYLTLTFTTVFNAKYFVAGYIELAGNTTSQQSRCQFMVDTKVLARYIDRPKVANTEVMPQSFAYIYTGTGSSATFRWQVSSSNPSHTCIALRARIYAIRVDNLPNAEYQSVYYEAEVRNVNNVWGDENGDTFEVTINPASAGYYLIWASAKVESDSTTSSVAVRLNIDNEVEFIPYLIGGENTWSYARIEDTAASEEHCFAIVAVRQFSPGTHSIKFQIADINGTASADWQYISLVTLRLTEVFDFYSASTITQASTSSTTFQTYTSLTIPSERAGEYLVLGGIVARGNSTSYDLETDLVIDEVSYTRRQIRPQDTNDYVPHAFMQKVTLDANSHTIATRYRTLNSAMTVFVKNSDILAIRLSEKNYQLDLEVQWININYTKQNEYLCIYAGALSSESLRVDVWTGSTWMTIINALGAGWNNISVSAYLASSTFTIRFRDIIASGDAAQSSWEIDCVLLHAWDTLYVAEVEFTGASDPPPWSQLTWAVDSCLTDADVNVTLQLFDYWANQYPTDGDGYVSYISSGTPNTDETRSQTITANPERFRDSSSNWKIKVKCEKRTSTQFDLKVDWIVLEASVPSQYKASTEFLFTEIPTDAAVQLNVTIVSHCNITGVEVTVQLWNYDLNTYVESGEGYLQYLSSGVNETKILIITASPESYIRDGEAKIRITAVKNTTSPFQQEINEVELCFHAFKYDYVLQGINQVLSDWKIRLRAYDQSNIVRLSNCTIYFHTLDGATSQVTIINGEYSQQQGDWYDLTGLSTAYIAMAVSASNGGTSRIYAYLEVNVPDTTIYNLLVIEFEIS